MKWMRLLLVYYYTLFHSDILYIYVEGIHSKIIINNRTNMDTNNTLLFIPEAYLQYITVYVTF